jgi:hypothetical protein
MGRQREDAVGAWKHRGASQNKPKNCPHLTPIRFSSLQSRNATHAKASNPES